jgi:hypothetical protein
LLKVASPFSMFRWKWWKVRLMMKTFWGSEYLTA